MNPENIVIGTWGISGAFGYKSDDEVLDVFKFAVESGIEDFDTAPVYANGRAERLLGSVQKPNMRVSTKVPAIRKPDLNEQSPGCIQDYYPIGHIQRMVEASLQRLSGKQIDVLFLHNWHPAWNTNSQDALDYMRFLQSQGFCKRTGVSLPNAMEADFPKGFDVVQVPLNLSETWAVPFAAISESEVWARSTLAHGALIKTTTDFGDQRADRYTDDFLQKVGQVACRNPVSDREKLRRAVDFVSEVPGISKLIMGVRTKEHITQLLKLHGQD